ncbi:MAG: hypothetical protein HZY76_19690 [Anaerolineae bacterium]|nr:MAG: hypothetical protein HZY76_19690 [Anaerolineae bacterium]
MYRLTYGDLLAAGVPVATTNPATFAMTYLGQPIAIEVTGRMTGGSARAISWSFTPNPIRAAS